MNFRHGILKTLKNNNIDCFNEKELFNLFKIKTSFEKKELLKALEQLQREGLIYYDKTKRKFASADNSSVYKGKVCGNKRGYAFIIVDDKIHSDIFVSPHNLHGAMHEDTVLVKKFTASGKNDEGEVVAILQRGIKQIVGTYISSHSYGFVESDDQRYYADVFIPLKDANGAKNGDKVVAQITDFPDSEKNPQGKIIEVLGKSNNIKTDILSIIRSHNLYEKFPQNVVKEAIAVSRREINNEGREDLTDLLIFTIDGEDAKDLDDAISLYKKGEIYELGVHIADVSHYVEDKSPLDEEALKRGTSVYFPDMVLPMLPKELSNGICSLNPDEERLALSVIMQVDTHGKVKDYKITQSVIKSHARLTYTQVENVLTGNGKLAEEYAEINDALLLMKELAEILINKRGRRGSIDFDLPEAQVFINNGDVEDIRPYPRLFSNKIIEEFMILTNETVAKFCTEKGLPFIYRVHEKPSEEKMLAFKKFLSGLGYSLNGDDDTKPLYFSMLLNGIEGKPEYSLINKVMLRAMMKAKYSTENAGHFGLASKCYCHFTAPIRRYPDLFIHRVIKRFLNGEKFDGFAKKAQNASLIGSEREQLAIEAEREIEDYYKAKYMEKFIGETYEGIISGVTGFGIFVELKNTVEGMIKVENLPGTNYQYFKEQYMLKNAGYTFKLGSKIKITVDYADARSKRIDFLMAE